MTQGDRVTVIIDLGAGYTRDEVTEATLPGGRVVATLEDHDVTVEERSRPTKGNPDGALLRSSTFRRNSVIGVIEQPKGRR